MLTKVFPSVSDSKESVNNARDPGSVPTSGRSPGEGNDYPLQYSCLENPIDASSSLTMLKSFDCMDQNKLWKILKEMGIPDHLTCLLRNLYAGQEATDRTGHGTMD